MSKVDTTQWDEWEIWEDKSKQKKKEKRINLLFTDKMKFGSITKEIYFSLKNEPTPKLRKIDELLEWPESWSYVKFRWLMWNYPEYKFWTKLSDELNYLGSEYWRHIYFKI